MQVDGKFIEKFRRFFTEAAKEYAREEGDDDSWTLLLACFDRAALQSLLADDTPSTPVPTRQQKAAETRRRNRRLKALDEMELEAFAPQKPIKAVVVEEGGEG